jgi:hypothetical protein
MAATLATEKSDLLRSHDSLRAAVRRRDSSLLQLMRRMLREARTVAKAEGSKSTKAETA